MGDLQRDFALALLMVLIDTPDARLAVGHFGLTLPYFVVMRGSHG